MILEYIIVKIAAADFTTFLTGPHSWSSGPTTCTLTFSLGSGCNSQGCAQLAIINQL